MSQEPRIPFSPTLETTEVFSLRMQPDGRETGLSRGPFNIGNLAIDPIANGIASEVVLPAVERIGNLLRVLTPSGVTTDTTRYLLEESLRIPECQPFPDAAVVIARARLKSDSSRIQKAVIVTKNLSDQDTQEIYSRQLLDLLNVASEIRAGRAEQLAERIELSLEGHLNVMMEFDENIFKTATFHLANLHYESSGNEAPENLKVMLSKSTIAMKQVLSDDCYAPVTCTGGADCHKWPTSLTAVDPDTPDPMGWHYIKGSHCGFHWPRFWKPACGQPLGLTACTG